ncbi:MAG: hypothetical protein E7446_07325 [Ruminococcaceae bacterium]|nr:hypothetical protein [Oscillospiraceae bacterium]
MEKNKKEKNVDQATEAAKSRKILKIALSILIAIGIWLYVDEEKAVNVKLTVHDIPVEFAGEDTVLADNGLMLLSGYDTTIDLTLKGPRKVLWKLDTDEIRIVVDTSSVVDTGVQSLNYEVIYPDNIQRSELTVEWASSYAVTVSIGQLYTKEVDIRYEVTGSPASGFVAESVILDPEKLVLRAQRDDLLNVNYAKVSVDISGAQGAEVQTVEYQLYDYNDIPIENDNIRANTKLIQVLVPVKMVKDVPLRINFVEAVGSTLEQVDYSFTRDMVQLKGEKEVLDAIDGIVLDTIYLQDLAEYQSLTYEIPIPEGTEIVGGAAEVVVTITVNGVLERRVTTSNFAAANVPEGFTAEFATESLEILLRGLSAEVNALTGNNLLITADLSGIQEAGNYTVPATVEINGYSNIGVKGSYQVIVNVVPPAAPDNGVQTAALDDSDDVTVQATME